MPDEKARQIVSIVMDKLVVNISQADMVQMVEDEVELNNKSAVGSRVAVKQGTGTGEQRTGS